MEKEKKPAGQEKFDTKETKPEEQKPHADTDKTENYLSIGLCLGLCAGVVAGTLTNNIGLYLPIGLCLGLAIGTVIKKK